MTGTTAEMKKALGAYGETIAARHLVEQGMVVLDRNWRCDAGEIDVVLRDGPVLVICEVKTRAGVDFGHPHEAVRADKVDRLIRLGVLWQQAHGVPAAELRIDLVCVLRPRKGPSVIDHVRGVV